MIEISSSISNCLIETQVEVWENEKCCRDMSRQLQATFFTAFSTACELGACEGQAVCMLEWEQKIDKAEDECLPHHSLLQWFVFSCSNGHFPLWDVHAGIMEVGLDVCFGEHNYHDSQQLLLIAGIGHLPKGGKTLHKGMLATWLHLLK